MVGDLAALDAHHIDCLEVDLAVSWSDPKKRPFMRAAVRFVRRHSIAVGKLPVDLRVKARECGPKISVKLSYTRLVRRRAPVAACDR